MKKSTETAVLHKAAENKSKSLESKDAPRNTGASQAERKDAGQANDLKPADKERYRRPNYWKYDEVKEVLKECLEKDMTTGEIVQHTRMSPVTVYKYKSMLCLETGITYMSRDERTYLDSRKSQP